MRIKGILMEKKKSVILFVHGFMGSKRQFYGLREALSGCGVDMLIHVLPGHEASLEEFLGTDAQIWQQSVDEAVIRLSDEYEKILLVGHSMGGLLSVNAAISEPEKVSGIVAIAFPIKIALKPQWVINNLKATRPAKEGEDPRVTAARTMSGVTLENPARYLASVKQSLEFAKVRRASIKSIDSLKTPLTVINFRGDEIVSRRAAGFVKAKLPGARVISLNESYHFLFSDKDIERIAEEIKRML